MPLTISAGNLSSRIVRNAVTSGGIRRFATQASGIQQQNSNGGIIGTLWNGFTRFGGFLISGVMSLLGSAAQFSWTLLWGLTTSTLQFLWHFNWNASDEELDQTINSAFNAIASSLGGTLGNAAGFLVGGVLPGAAIFCFNEPLGLYVLKNVSEEMMEELAGNVANLVRQTTLSVVRASITFLYKNVRRIWREPDSQVKAKLISAGMSQEKIDKTIAERNKPWSFAQTFEDWIDAIPNDFVKNFTEEFFDEFFDSTTEAGYVVANSLDSYLAAQQIAATNAMGPVQTVQIQLNRQIP